MEYHIENASSKLTLHSYIMKPFAGLRWIWKFVSLNIFFYQPNSISKMFTFSKACLRANCLSACLSDSTSIKFSGLNIKHPCHRDSIHFSGGVWLVNGYGINKIYRFESPSLEFEKLFIDNHIMSYKRWQKLPFCYVYSNFPSFLESIFSIMFSSNLNHRSLIISTKVSMYFYMLIVNIFSACIYNILSNV
jgi:hypothetical protein